MSGVRIERDGRAAVVRLDKARGNAIDEPLVLALAEAAAEVARDDSVRGVMLASAHPKLFCPGLDLVALADYDRPAMERFMSSFAVTVWALYGLPKPIVAAVSGAAVAGGCILALTADHRVLRRGGDQHAPIMPLTELYYALRFGLQNAAETDFRAELAKYSDALRVSERARRSSSGEPGQAQPG